MCDFSGGGGHARNLVAACHAVEQTPDRDEKRGEWARFRAVALLPGLVHVGRFAFRLPDRPSQTDCGDDQRAPIKLVVWLAALG